MFLDMARFRKPKKLRLPKRPKMSASNEVLKRYLDRVASVKKENSKRLAEYNSKIKQREKLLNRIKQVA